MCRFSSCQRSIDFESNFFFGEMGIPVGSDIEYTDEVTMLKAMEGRREI